MRQHSPTLCWALIVAVVSQAGIGLSEAAWQADEFPISYWSGPPAGLNRLETWKTVRDCNFTFAGPRGGYSLDDNRKMLDFCQQVGIKAMVVDQRISWTMVEEDNWKDAIGRIAGDYGSHPALFGYYLQDEPNHQLFQPLGLISREFLKRDPKHLPYINLFPTYASVEQLGNPTYADHLEKFLTIVKPAVLSYDHYCLMKDGTDRADYFENLSLIREHGLSHGVPPWNIILSTPHLAYRDPTAAEMRWQVYTSLAYGMKGLMYFTYWTEKEWETNGLAIVNSEGKPARLYPIVQQLNAEIKALGRTLLGLTSTGVFHTGGIATGCARLSGDALVQASADTPLVFGFFQDASGMQYAMIVNRNHKAAAEFDATFKPHITTVTELKAAGGEAVVQAANHQLHLKLEPGDGKLLRLATQFRHPEPAKPFTAVNFQFNTEGDTEGWGGFNSLNAPVVKEGMLALTFTGEDPFLCRTYLRIPSDTYQKIKVRMKLPQCEPTGQLFWTTSDEPQFRDDKYLNFPVIPDGQWHEYEIPVANHVKWKGKAIRAIRLDPTTAGAMAGSKVEIDWIVGE